MKKAFYNSIFIALFGVGVNFLFKIITASVIGKEDLALYFTTVDIFTLTLLVLVGFRSSMVVAFSQLGEARNIINIFRIVVVVVVLLVWSVIIPILKHKMGVDIHYWYLVAMVIGMSLVLYFSNLLAMYRLYELINRVTLLEPIFLLIWFVVVFFLFNIEGTRPLFIATIMSSFMVVIYIYFMKHKYFPSISFQKPMLSGDEIRFIKNSVISTIEFGSGMLLLYLVVILIMQYFSLDELGDFQVVTKPIFGYMVMLFVFPIFRFVLPELSKLFKEKKKEQIVSLKNWILRYAFIVSGLFLLLMLLFGDAMVNLLFPKEYAGAALMIKHLAFFFIFLILNAYQIAFIKASGAFMSALFVRTFGIVVLVCSFYGIYFFYSQSIISVIMALILSYVGMFVVSFFIERKIMKRL